MSSYLKNKRSIKKGKRGKQMTEEKEPSENGTINKIIMPILLIVALIMCGVAFWISKGVSETYGGFGGMLSLVGLLGGTVLFLGIVSFLVEKIIEKK